MFQKGMDNRGQISAEYLLLMVVFILILTSITVPLATKSIDASNDVTKVTDAKVAVTSLAEAANVVYANGPGAKRVLNIYIPQNDMKIVFSGSQISTNVTLSDGTVKTVTAKTNYPVNGYTYTLSEGNHNAVLICLSTTGKISHNINN